MRPHPIVPLLQQGEGMATSPCRSATSLSFARRGTFWRKPKQGEVRIGGQETTGSTRIATSPCLLRRHPSPSQRRGNCDLTLLSLSFARRGTFWRKPKQGEVARSSKHFFCHSEHFLLSFQVLFFVIPSQSEESAHGCFAALSMTNRGSVDAALGMTR